jgi:hypothetical protein
MSQHKIAVFLRVRPTKGKVLPFSLSLSLPPSLPPSLPLFLSTTSSNTFHPLLPPLGCPVRSLSLGLVHEHCLSRMWLDAWVCKYELLDVNQGIVNPKP